MTLLNNVITRSQRLLNSTLRSLVNLIFNKRCVLKIIVFRTEFN